MLSVLIEFSILCFRPPENGQRKGILRSRRRRFTPVTAEEEVRISEKVQSRRPAGLQQRRHPEMDKSSTRRHRNLKLMISSRPLSKTSTNTFLRSTISTLSRAFHWKDATSGLLSTMNGLETVFNGSIS